LVMAGGKGIRMRGEEKPLILLLGRPLISFVLEALNACREVDSVVVITSPYTPATTSYLSERGYAVHVAAGGGFMRDLSSYLSRERDGLFLVVSSDVPTLRPEHFVEAINIARVSTARYLMFVLPLDLVAGLSRRPTIIRHGGAEYAPTGLRSVLVEGGAVPDLSSPSYVVFPYRELGVNVNTPEDLAIATSYFCEEGGDKNKRIEGGLMTWHDKSS